MAFLSLFLGFSPSAPRSGVRSVASLDHYISPLFILLNFQVFFGNEIKAFTRNYLFSDLPRGFLAAFF